jgi:threonine dehydrogenase-like Zn-dependent dehydrogenase
MRARALWHVGPGRCVIREESLRAPGPDEVLVETRFGAVSRGTESLVAQGRVPPALHASMRGPHMGGAFPFPVKYGYSAAGEVVGGALPVGTPVFCLHPHQDRFVVPVADVVPTDAPLERAILAPNLETAINALWDGGVGPGDRVAVIGAGVLGCLVGWLASKVVGCEVTLVDVLPERRAIAAALGVPFAEQAPGDRDVVVHTSATEAGLRAAFAALGPEGALVELSWYGDVEVKVSLGGPFHPGRQRLIGSQVGQVPPSRRGRWTHRRRLELALRLAADPVLEALVSSEGSFDQLFEEMPLVLSRQGLCHRVRYR